MKLRSHLVLLTVAAVTPVLLFSAVLVRLYARQELAATERGLRDTARALAIAVDRELENHLATVRTMAAADDPGTLRADAARALETQPEWVSLTLTAASGRELFHLRRPGRAVAAAHAPHGETAPAPLLGPIVGGLAERSPGDWTFAIHAPVGGARPTGHVLTVEIGPAAMADVLRAQQPPAGWTAAILDARQTIVARNRLAEQFVGQPATPDLAAQIQVRPEAFFVARSKEGRKLYTAYSRAPTTGWAVAIGVPADVVHAQVRRTLWTIGGGGAALLVLGGGLAALLGRRIAGAIQSLTTAAAAIGRGDRLPGTWTARVTELGALQASLARAAALLEERLGHERAARQEAEAIATIGRELAQSLDPTIVAERIAERVCRLLHGQVAVVYALEAETGDLVAIARAGELAERLGSEYRLPAGSGLVARATRERRTVTSADLLVDPAVSYPPAERARIEHAGHRAACAVPLLVQGEVIGALGIGDREGRVFDRSAVRLAETFADLAAIALDNARRFAREQALRLEAEATNRAKDEFLAMLGHELRNPLGAVATAVAVLESSAADRDRTVAARGVIARQVRQLSRLVDDLLDVARVTSGKIRLDRRPTDLARIVERALSGLAAAQRTVGHRVELRAEPVWVEADETRIEQVVGNLVENAVKFTPRGGEVRVTVEREGPWAVLEVADTGQGIPADLLPRVFDLFIQGERPLDRTPGGLGLGLTLVRRLVTLHGGAVTAASDGPGKGATFTVRLPALECPGGDGARAPGGNAVAPRRVLVVEDNADGREMLRLLLTLDGHAVEEAEDGTTAIDIALARRPDLVLVDIGLPGIDGYEVARRIRSALGVRRPVLVALTGYGQADDRRRAEEAGFDLHLVKPVTPETIRAVMAR